MTTVYESIREEIVAGIKAEMMGPGSETITSMPDPDEIKYEMITENPFRRYSVGILYEQKIIRDAEDESAEDRDIDGEADVDELLDVAATTANQYYPSSIGMSFYATGLNPGMVVKVSAARYKRLKWDECRVQIKNLPPEILSHPLFQEQLSWQDDNLQFKRSLDKETREPLRKINGATPEWERAIYKLFDLRLNGWKRSPLVVKPITISFSDTNGPSKKHFGVCEGLRLLCIRRPSTAKNSTLFTLALINDFEGGKLKNVEKTFFQVGFSVKPTDHQVTFLDYERLVNISLDTRDPEELSMALLYRNRQVFGVGHGCAVSWNEEGTRLKTEIMPVHEVPSHEFNVDELTPVADILCMRNLSDITPLTKLEIIKGLTEFVAIYRKWIDKKQALIYTLDESLQGIAKKHIAECYASANRLLRGVELLDNDPEIFLAFQLANKAMLLQRAHGQLQQNKRYPDEGEINWPDYGRLSPGQASWRPFQLAFLLLNIGGINNPNSGERDIVDLLWFPTGGGKTEAYLGLSAFVIFLRRLRHSQSGAGTAIIMRYTLRLLTTQQFQRASTLICACEYIRRQKADLLGKAKISLGLWIGGSSTPNSLDNAEGRLNGLLGGNERNNPFQILSCPWCGTRLTPENGRGSWGYEMRSRPRRFVIHCTEKTCAFYNELPITIIDEDIYRELPTLLFGTVDKFALLPWRKEIKKIFGLSTDFLAPELIIQDELHLISGPLGTMVGLYETAIDILCSTKGLAPKIIASTATIRRANDQVKALYNRKVNIFPPSGIDADDSFFAREVVASEKPGRMYAGIMATGKTLTTTQIRLMAGLLQHVYGMDHIPETKDPYWTLVCYFNTIRELGRTSTLALSSIKDQMKTIARRKNIKQRYYYEADELTGSRKSTYIPAMLDRLEKSYPDENAVHILLATNMISVGIDIDRFGLMTVIGQPKSSSEYIQATSRVGRKYPGLIFTLYDGARPRDRSHYERFTAYHQALYRYVEPTSVTPFSGPARERALHAVLVALARHILDDMSGENQARKFRAAHPGLTKIIAAIMERVRCIMPEEAAATASDLGYLIAWWEDIAEIEEALTYAKRGKKHLLYPAHKRQDEFWPTMQSMRNVDAPGNIRIIGEGEEGL